MKKKVILSVAPLFSFATFSFEIVSKLKKVGVICSIKKMNRLFFCSCVLIFTFSSCTHDAVKPAKVIATDSVILYSKTIAPLVEMECSSSSGCHETASGNGDFTNYNGLKSKVDNGSLYNRIVTLKDMPQKGSGYTLTDQQRDYFAAWIKQGALNN